ncbi:MAG: epimerase, partial [Deltaproteobacteria bacterium]|nr:epimerase [Deltaproteobacteria bacterium]
GIVFLLRFLRKFGLKADLPAELMFLDNFYKSQSLSAARLEASSFVDPMPEETIFTRLPGLVIYYLTRWSHQNLITTYDETFDFKGSVEDDFVHNPMKLLESVHAKSIGPFPEMMQDQ